MLHRIWLPTKSVYSYTLPNPGDGFNLFELSFGSPRFSSGLAIKKLVQPGASILLKHFGIMPIINISRILLYGTWLSLKCQFISSFLASVSLSSYVISRILLSEEKLKSRPVIFTV